MAYNESLPSGPPLCLTKNEAEELIKEYGSPFYFYDLDQVNQHLLRLRSQIPYAAHKVLYSMKANFNPYLLSLLQKQGTGIEAISTTEIHLALEIGFSKDKILFTSNNLTDEEMHVVHGLGILLNIDSMYRLERYGQSYPGSRVSIRINTGVVAGEFKEIQTAREDCKFGIKISSLPAVLELIKKYDLKVVGIHQHAGSGIQLSSEFLESASHTLDIVRKEDFPHVEFVDLGGGLKARYKLNDKEPDFQKLFSIFAGRFTEISKNYGRDIELVIEPGKFLVAESGHLVSQVVEIKDEILPGVTLVAINSSFAHLVRPVLYGAYHHIINLSNPEGPLKKYQVVGNICESGDIFADDREIPTIRVGDILCFLTAGAYCYSMGSLYNLRPLPPEILRKDDTFFCGRRRLLPIEMAKTILAEANFKSS